MLWSVDDNDTVAAEQGPQVSTENRLHILREIGPRHKMKACYGSGPPCTNSETGQDAAVEVAIERRHNPGCRLGELALTGDIEIGVCGLCPAKPLPLGWRGGLTQ